MDSSPYGLLRLWLDGDVVTRLVAVVLLALSVVSWTVMIRRGWQQFRLRRAGRSVHAFWHHKAFSDGLASLAHERAHAPYWQLAVDGQAACQHHAENRDDLHGQISLSEWLTESLRGSIDDNAERQQSGLPLLASIGATAPFVGLLGTVWGIYHALIAIGASGQSTIDKVAGPVGEALIMTAAGLFVAIPAVLGYNALSRANRRTVSLMHRFARQLHAYFLTGSPGGSNGKPEMVDARNGRPAPGPANALQGMAGAHAPLHVVNLPKGA